MSSVVFVYGSLLSGLGNHGVIADGELMGQAVTSERRFTMLSLGPFPMVVSKGTDQIVGELYRVDAETLRDLDRLEGAPHFYRRESAEFVLEDGTVHAAIIYVKAECYDVGRNTDSHIVPAGDWRTHYTRERIYR